MSRSAPTFPRLRVEREGARGRGREQGGGGGMWEGEERGREVEEGRGDDGGRLCAD